VKAIAQKQVFIEGVFPWGRQFECQRQKAARFLSVDHGEWLFALAERNLPGETTSNCGFFRAGYER
jgi:hypothetical protein